MPLFRTLGQPGPQTRAAAMWMAPPGMGHPGWPERVGTVILKSWLPMLKIKNVYRNSQDLGPP